MIVFHIFLSAKKMCLQCIAMEIFRTFTIFVPTYDRNIMPDFLTKEERSIRMSHIHSANTKPELALRHALWRLGFRYRTNDRRFPGSPDIVLPKYRTVIFVHGCFWHGHQNCKNYKAPKTNPDFWAAKITRNRERDQKAWRSLEAKGWNVIVIWECELARSRIIETIDSVAARIRENGRFFHQAKENRRQAREEYRQRMDRKKKHDASIRKEIEDLF